MTFQTSARHLTKSRLRLAPIGWVVIALFAGACSETTNGDAFSDALIDRSDLINSDQIITAPEISEDTIVWLHDIEPATLNGQSESNLGSSTASWISQGLLEGLFGVTTDLGYEPELLDVTPIPEETDDGVVIEYTLKDDLVWSDGEALTTQDVAYTFERIAEGCGIDSDDSIQDNSDADCVLDWVDRSGYSAITALDIVSEQEFSVTLSRPVGDWQRLFDTVFAEHSFGDSSAQLEDRLLTFSNDGAVLPSSGPYELDSWTPGEFLALTPNENHRDFDNASPTAQSQVIVRFLPNRATLETNLDAGRGHFILNDIANEPLAVESSDITFASTGGWQWEHLGMNLTNSHLENVVVREAVAAALDKPALSTSVFEPFHGVTSDSGALGNSFWMSYQAAYVDNQAEYAATDLDLVTENMESLGYARDEGGSWVHPELGEPAFRIAVIEGDLFRIELANQIVAQLDAVGFDSSVVEIPGGDFFTTSASGEGPFASNQTWDLTLFSWASGPWPGGQISAYGGQSSANNINNIYDYSNGVFDEAAQACSTALDPAEVANCFNELDLFATTVTGDTGLFIVPLGERPSILAYNGTILAEPVINDFPGAGPLTALSHLSPIDTVS